VALSETASVIFGSILFQMTSELYVDKIPNYDLLK